MDPNLFYNTNKYYPELIEKEMNLSTNERSNDFAKY